MSVCSGARATWSRPAVALVRLAMAEMALPIGCRSAASPETSCCSVLTRPASSPLRVLTVCSTELRLPITSPMTWSLVASVVVSEPTVATSWVMLGLSPWKIWMISLESWLTSPGGQRLEQRLEPVEQLGQVQRGRGPRHRDRRPRAQRLADRAGALAQLHVPLPDQVEVLDRRGGRGGQRAALLDREADERQVALVDADRGDVADPDAGDVHVVAHVEPGDVGEHGLVADRGGHAGVRDAEAEDHRDRDRHDDEDDAT